MNIRHLSALCGRRGKRGGAEAMLIACDVDGVAADLHTEWLRRYNRDYADTLTLDRLTSWDLHRYTKPECGHRVYDYLSDHDLYEHVSPVAGAAAVIDAWRTAGHRVIFLSACTYGMTDQKAQWLVRHGFSLGRKRGALPDDFIPIREKHLVRADVLIDDAPHNLEAWWHHNRRPSVVVSMPYNFTLRLPGMLRASDWPGIAHAVQFFDRRRPSPSLTP